MIAYGLEWHTLDTYFSFSELGTEPETPESGMLRLFAEDNGSGISQLCYKNDAGTKICLPTSGSFITGTGAAVAGQVTFWTGTASIGGDAGFLWDNTNKRLAIGNTTPEARLTILGETAAQASIRINRAEASAAGPQLNLSKARGTPGSEADVQDGDSLGLMTFGGWANSDFQIAKAYMEGLAGVNWTASDNESELSFFTTPTGTTTATEKMRLLGSGFLGIGTTDPTALLHTKGTASTSALRSERVEAAAGAAQLNLLKARGTPGSEAATQSGDGLGLVGFGGWADGAWRAASAFIQSVAGSLWSSTNRESYITFSTTPSASITQAEGLRITSLGSLLTGRGASSTFLAALATNATDGFLYIPTCAGDPTGTPTAFTGKVAMVFDTTNNELNIYDGSWLKAAFA